MLTLDLTPLEHGQHHLTVEPAAEDLSLDPAAFDEVVAEIYLDYQADRLVVHLAISALATLECDRTLVPYDERIAGEHTLALLPASQVAQRQEGSASDDEVRPLPQPGQPLDLTRVARDTLLLAVPARRIAPGAEERDIKLVYGEGEERIDPRWEALRRLGERS